MNKHLFTAAFLLGALGIVWVGFGFIDSSFLALGMTAVIGAVYAAGGLELRRFRQATATLNAALAAIPNDLADLGGWLDRVDPSMQNAVRARIEGERVALPGPSLTPYLVGLLVMLGMLGTFLGMVVTLKGAVFALEKTTDLQAMRSALSVPVKGLGLAFGTSVAGVAASAMLGLMSAFSRRERLQAAQLLDTRIATDLRRFSLTHQRQETYKALQQQSQALPQVVDKLNAMMTQMEGMQRELNQRLVSNQEQFHGSVKTVYTDLAASVDRSLRESLGQSAQAAGESIKPVVEATMNNIAHETQALHARLAETAQLQLAALSERFEATTASVADTWTAALKTHEQTSAGIAADVGRSLEAFNASFEQRSAALVSTFDATAASVADTWTAALKTHEQTSAGIAADVGRSLEAFNASFEERSAALVSTVGESYAALQSAQAEQDRQRQQAWTQSLEAMAATLARELQETGAETLRQQQAACATLTGAAQEIAQQTQDSARTTLAETTRLVASAEDLMRTRIAAEAQWMDQHRERMDQLAGLLRGELGALRNEEARAAAAVERLAQLETAVASHLTTLGTALEQPIARLIETASEAPRAAAEVIGQLREQISGTVARDNALLEERSRIMETLNGLLEAINHASLEQRTVIDTLVASSEKTLNAAAGAFAENAAAAAGAFAENAAAEAGKLSDIAAQVTSSAADVASLGETFGVAVQAFHEANEKLIANLQRIEGAMDKSMSRSDEQLAYYVAQAREIIDLSMMSQKEIVEALRQLPARQNAVAEEVR
ncbi:DUF802 domain-containing protein [Oxalobacteraceae bacterium OM1]|nr:DUF802 domain-containing protein [Oxalobacteraceae bacterium OM1]